MQKFMLESNTYFGIGAVKTLPQALVTQGFQQVGIVIDENIASLSPSLNLLKALEMTDLSIVCIYNVRTSREPNYSYLDEVANTMRMHDFDVLLGIGGGSTLDIAKGVGILLKNPGRGIDYRGMDKVKNQGVPVVLIPTTAGTGSEATRTASFVDSETKTKLGINGRYVNCLFAVLDPEFVTTCPKMPKIAAGLDVLVHAVEAVTCKTANAVSILLGCEAVRLMFDALPKAVKNQKDLVAHEKILLGSHYAGLAMWNAGGGPASGISYPLGVYYSVPHGFAGGLLLPHVVGQNIDAGYYEGYAAIIDHLNKKGTHSKTEQEKAKQFSSDLFELYQDVDAPKTFNSFGVGRDDISLLTRLTLEQRRVNLELNPVSYEESDVVSLLEKVLI